MKKFIILGLFFITISFLSYANIEKKFNVIIFTDGAPDDLRAICLLMAIKEVQIDGIIASSGALQSDSTLKKLNSLITYFDYSGIPVAKGLSDITNIPSFRPMCESLSWGTKINTAYSTTLASDLLKKQLPDLNSKKILIVLSPLTDLAEFLKNNPDSKNNIKKIIWYNEKFNPSPGFNYDFNTKSAEYILHTGIDIDIISSSSSPEALFNDSLLNEIQKINTPFAQLPFNSFSTNKPIMDKISSGHFKLWDDLIPVYLIYPELFDLKPQLTDPNIRYCKSLNINAIKLAMMDIYSQKYSTEKLVVFNGFPIDKSLYSYDLQPYVDEIIQRHGLPEWKACIITNEFHGHLGVYSIIGAKMGIRAREYFNTPTDKLQVISFAGSKTPLSCMNDGLQVSTGATVGQGLITISDDLIKRPEAKFIYKNDSVRIKLKDEYINRIEQDMQKGIIEYGLLTDGYWKMVRKLAIQYWLDMDRKEIFEIN